ncbi:DUF2345 domain-containing protein [Commensalibacter intestini]|nr:DUF2345 domain-containing protein [Commensalibacter intestini]
MTLIESAITMLQQASVLISAPAGIAQTTPSTIQHNAGRNVITTAGKDVSLNAKNNVTMAASEEISLFAHNKDLRAVAGYGKVELQAQQNQMNLDAKQDIQITSHDGKLTLYSPTEINLVCGKNSFIHMNHDQVIINASDHIIKRTAVVMKQNPGSMPLNIPPLPEPIGNYDEMFVVKNKKGEPLPHFRYKLVTGDGEIIRGVTNEKGETARVETSTNKIKIDVYEDDDDEDQSSINE